jgi:hypothetical protein
LYPCTSTMATATLPPKQCTLNFKH